MAGTLVRDMTEGSPTRRIVEFFFPLLFGLLFQQVYNMVDTIVVGKFLGVKALAGVGSTGSWCWDSASACATTLPSPWPKNSASAIIPA